VGEIDGPMVCFSGNFAMTWVGLVYGTDPKTVLTFSGDAMELGWKELSWLLG
jgi:hypothetical protein